MSPENGNINEIQGIQNCTQTTSLLLGAKKPERRQLAASMCRRADGTKSIETVSVPRCARCGTADDGNGHNGPWDDF